MIGRCHAFPDRACRRRPPRARPAGADPRDRLRQTATRVLFLAREFPPRGCAVSTPPAEAVREAVSRVGLDPEGRVAFKQGRPRAPPLPRRLLRPGRPGRRAPAPRRDRAGAAPGRAALVLVGEWRWLDWRLGGARLRRGRAAGEAEGERFHVARLDTARSRRPNRLPQAMRVEGMPLALLVNPASAHGRTLKLLPRLEQELDARRVVLPGRAHAGPRGRSRAGPARRRGRRAAGRDQRRRPDRRGRRCAGRLGDAARDRPRRARQRPRPRARRPRRAGGCGGDARRRGRRAASTSARSTASASSASSASASTPKRTGSPTKPSGCAAISSTPTPACAPCSAGSRPASRFGSDERARALHRLLGLGRQQQGLRRRHVHRPRRRPDRRRVRRGRRSARSASCASWVTCPRCSRAPTSRRTRCGCFAPRGSS